MAASYTEQTYYKCLIVINFYVEVEEAILGGILLDPNAISVVADILPIKAFCPFSNQQIYKAALELYKSNKQTDLITVSTCLLDHKLLEKVGGNNKLSQLLTRTVSAINVDHYAGASHFLKWLKPTIIH
ncbi:MAG: DnaB-like helicase N-terminal domain-containing protein [Nostoc sp.]|uniref:DnaB-like helicase N-terminal domain-containing protein n=1 Tax=Nostoc sp. TaxID=1180 RepID=UPI002FF7D356